MLYPKLYNRASKVHEQSQRHVFVGLCPDQPGYCCVNPDTGAFISSPHVRFVEHCLPGLEQSGQHTTINPDFAPDFDPLATAPFDPGLVDITQLGDEIVGGDGDGTLDPARPARAISGPAQAIDTRQARSSADRRRCR